MRTDEISREAVDADSALALRSASEQDRQKLEVLLRLRLRLRESLINQGSLLEIMDEISREAVANGLTPEIL